MGIENNGYNLSIIAPQQSERIERGHRVFFVMDGKKYRADLLPMHDTEYLKKIGVEREFSEKNKKDESIERILLTDTTPVAQALLGKSRGDLTLDGDIKVVEVMLSPFLIRKVEN